MRNGPDSTAVVRAPEPESFGNRKLIRPSLNREQARATEAAVERRERMARPAESTAERSLERNLERNPERKPERKPERIPGASKKFAPPEQTHAENFYY